MLHIVQLVEHQIVALEVVSSNLTMHPIMKGINMKNISLDICMSIICIVLILSIFGMLFLEDVLSIWKDMRK